MGSATSSDNSRSASRSMVSPLITTGSQISFCVGSDGLAATNLASVTVVSSSGAEGKRRGRRCRQFAAQTFFARETMEFFGKSEIGGAGPQRFEQGEIGGCRTRCVFGDEFAHGFERCGR